jgi:Ran GTPase-activating protein (RanGAP) involved in mRNA processing and transport
VTDAGLKELASLKNLSKLDLSDTQVTDEGLKELQKALPNCRIIQEFRR